jgi:type II secretory pathway pseudopilin PulG
MHVTTTERGFSYIDVMIAMSILLVGILTFGAALTAAIVRTQESEEQLQAKQICISTLEAVFSVRELKSAGFGWNAIAGNSEAAGVFLEGVQAVYETPGVDGIPGTADDATGGVLIPGFHREIVITRQLDTDFTPARDNMKEITIRVTYRVGGGQRVEEITTWIAEYQFEL